jgi:CBS domain-containing protein
VDAIQDLRVEQVMTPAPVCLEEDCTIAGALGLLIAQRYQAAPVVEASGRLLGLVTRAGLLAWLSGVVASAAEDLTVRELMSAPVRSVVDARPLRCSSGMRLKDASKLLVREQAPVALVVRDGQLAGILSLRDVVRAMAYGDEPAAPTVGHAHGHCFSPTGLPELGCEDEDEDGRLIELLLAQRP